MSWLRALQNVIYTKTQSTTFEAPGHHNRTQAQSASKESPKQHLRERAAATKEATRTMLSKLGLLELYEGAEDLQPKAAGTLRATLSQGLASCPTVLVSFTTGPFYTPYYNHANMSRELQK